MADKSARSPNAGATRLRPLSTNRPKIIANSSKMGCAGPLLSASVALCPLLSPCVRFCRLVSASVALCPLLSPCVRLCPLGWGRGREGCVLRVAGGEEGMLQAPPPSPRLRRAGKHPPPLKLRRASQRSTKTQAPRGSKNWFIGSRPPLPAFARLSVGRFFIGRGKL